MIIFFVYDLEKIELSRVKGAKLRNGQAQDDWPESYTSSIDSTISALKLHYCKVAKLC
jgi:hypothetical protein